MKLRCVATVLTTAAVVALSGCAAMKSTHELTRQTLRQFSFRPTDYRDTTEEKEDPWSQVGLEGRGNQPRQKEPDPSWLRNLLSSAKARNIERNVGIE